MKWFIFLISLSCFAGDPLLPNNKLTPGSIVNTPVYIVMQYGYTKTVRNVPEKIKRQVFINYFGTIPAKPSNYEIDHLISLELGGSNSISNLWPQSYISYKWNAHSKDKLENWMARRVREELRTNTVQSASNMLHCFQWQIATDWIAAYTNNIH